MMDQSPHLQTENFQLPYINLFDAMAGLRIIRPHVLSCSKLQVSKQRRRLSHLTLYMYYHDKAACTEGSGDRPWYTVLAIG